MLFEIPLYCNGSSHGNLPIKILPQVVKMKTDKQQNQFQ